MSFSLSVGDSLFGVGVDRDDIGIVDLGSVVVLTLNIALGSKFDSEGKFVKNVLEDGFSGSDISEFSDSSDVFSSAVVVFFSLHSSEVGELDFSLSSEFFSSDELLVGFVELGSEVNKVSLEFSDFVSEESILSEHVLLEDGEIFSGFDFVSGKGVSGVLEVEDQGVNHEEDSLLELGKVKSELFVSGSSESLELASGVVDVASSLLGSSSGSGGGVSVSLGVEGTLLGVPAGDFFGVGGELADFFLKLGEDELVLVVKEVFEFFEFLEEGSSFFVLLSEVIDDVGSEEGHDFDTFDVLTEGFDEEEIVLASFFFELFEESQVSGDSVLSVLDGVSGFLDLVGEPLDVGFQVVDVFGSVGQ